MAKFKMYDRCMANKMAVPLLQGKAGMIVAGPMDVCPVPHPFGLVIKGEWYGVKFNDQSVLDNPDTTWYCIAEVLDKLPPSKRDQFCVKWDDIERLIGWNPTKETVH